MDTISEERIATLQETRNTLTLNGEKGGGGGGEGLLFLVPLFTIMRTVFKCHIIICHGN